MGSVYILIRSYGGALTVSPTNREGAVNTTLANITMSYTHSISNYGWTSGVSNTTTTLTSGLIYGSGNHWLGVDSGEQGEMAVVFAHNDTGASTHSLALMYRWNGAWTETVLDNGTDTGQHPSVAIDREGALHIAYIDDHNDKLRYATNASGSWVFLTLGVSSYDNDGGRGTAIVVHPITDAVHIVTTIYENSSRDLQYHTNEGGAWVNETITNTSKDEGSRSVHGHGRRRQPLRRPLLRQRLQRFAHVQPNQRCLAKRDRCRCCEHARDVGQLQHRHDARNGH